MGVISLPAKFKCLLNSWARYKVFHGGRGSAKSRTIASALIHLGSIRPLRVLCAREVQKSIKDSVKLLLDDEIKRQGLEDEYVSTQTEIRNKVTGTLFLFSGLRSTGTDNIKSLEGCDIVWLEEADSISAESWQTLIPTIRKEKSEIWVSFNPRLVSDPVYQMFLTGDPPPDSIVVEVNYEDNPWFPEVLKREMEWDRSRDPDKYAHVWLGKPVVHSEAQVFNGAWKIDNVPEYPGGDPLYIGADWGFAQDPTAIVRCWIDDTKRTLYVDYEAGGIGIEIDDLPALFDMIPLSRFTKIKADSARPETISYVNRQGFRIVPTRKGKGSIEDGIAKLKGYNIVVDPRCKRLITELTLYSYKVDQRTGNILPFPEDKNNHWIDALRYAIEDVRSGHMLQNATNYVMDIGNML